MDKPVNKCMDCKARRVGCHTDCKDYIEYTEQYAAYKDWLNSNRKVKRLAEARPWYRDKLTRGRK